MMASNGSNVSLSVGDASPMMSRWMAIDAIDLYVTPVWYIIGIPGNILAFIVWVQRRMRPSSGCYLAALALDECLFLVMQVIVFQKVTVFIIAPNFVYSTPNQFSHFWQTYLT